MIFNTRSLIHPRMLDNMPNHFPSVCSIAHATITSDSYQEEVIVYATDPALAIIQCYRGTVNVVEKRENNQTVVTTLDKAVLRGLYTSIVVGDQATIDDVAYNITNVEHDGTATATALTIEKVTN